MRPDMPDPSIYAELMDRRRGPEAIVRHLIADVATSYEDLLKASHDVDAHHQFSGCDGRTNRC